MKARFIKLNDGGLQSCLNTMFTQDCKGKMPYEAFNKNMKAFIREFHEKTKLT